MRAYELTAAMCCLGGIGVATAAYGEHYNTGFSPCQINSVWDCGIVNHSPYAVWHGVPIALIGALGYGVLLLLIGRARWWAVGLAAAGCVFALRYTYVEDRVLHIWCLYCAISQVLIAAVVLLTLLAAMGERRRQRRAGT